MTRQGSNASPMFRGKGKSRAAELFYNESADFFADIIRNNIKPGTYSLADLGGHKGEFLAELLTKLPEYNFESTVIYREAGLESGVGKKVVGDIRSTPFSDKSIDVVILRYVLAWNLLADQLLVLKEISRICRGICIIQHQGADSSDPKPLQEASAKIFGGIVPRLKRDNGYFTESKQVERWLEEIGVIYEKIQERKIETLSETFIEKFNLSVEEADIIKNALCGCDYIMQSTYILRF